MHNEVSRKMKRSVTAKLFIALALFSAVSLTLAGCSGGGGGSSKLDKSAPVTLTWWTGQTQTAEKTLESLAKEFHTDHPNVTIQISSGAPTTTDLLQKISAAFVSGDTPDISYTYGYWGGTLAASGHMLDITKQVSAPDVHWDAFPVSARKIAAPAGKVIGMPSIVDVVSLMYNKALFDKAGLAYPTDDWTWDDFRQAAKKLTDKSTQTFGTAFPVDPGDAAYRFFPQFWQRGGTLLNADQTKSQLNSAAGVGTLDFMNSLAVKDKSVYLDQTGSKFEPLFVAGRIGMILDGPWLLSDLKTGHTDYGVVNLPGVDGKHTTISAPDIWALFDNHDANRAYWSYQLIKWLTDPAQDARYSLALGNLPLRPSQENDLPEFKKAVDTYPGFQSMAANLSNVQQALPSISAFPDLSDAVGTAMSHAMQGQGTSEENLKIADATTDKALAKK
jgi:multiple sugar transport system substrate-binding protein